MKLQWITKRRASHSDNFADVTISVAKKGAYKNGKERKRAIMYFRNNCDKCFSKNGYLTFALTADKIYFAESDDKTGFKLSRKSVTSNTAAINVSLDEQENGFNLKRSNSWIGDYSLEFDSVEKLWCINIANRIKSINQ